MPLPHALLALLIVGEAKKEEGERCQSEPIVRHYNARAAAQHVYGFPYPNEDDLWGRRNQAARSG